MKHAQLNATEFSASGPRKKGECRCGYVLPRSFDSFRSPHQGLDNDVISFTMDTRGHSGALLGQVQAQGQVPYTHRMYTTELDLEWVL